MKKVLVFMLMATSLAAAPTLTLAQTGDVCGPDGPAGYKRDGGYCERRNNSIYDLHDGDECSGLLSITMRKGIRLDVAQNCAVYECYASTSLGIDDELAAGDRVLVGMVPHELPTVCPL